MTAVAIAAAFCTAVAVGGVTWQIIHPRRSPLQRIAPYTEIARSRLGMPVQTTPQPVFAGEAARRLLGPLAATIGRAVSRLFRVTDPDTLNQRLRKAGNPMTAEAYRSRHLRWALLTPIGFAAAGILLSSTTLTLGFLAAGVFVGTRRMPDQLRSLTRRRASRVRSDLPTIAGILAAKLHNAKSLVVALHSVVSVGSGPVIADLARVLNNTDAGMTLADALEFAAREAVDPAGARFYRFLATATAGGIDLPRALLDQATELRTQRREEVERIAAGRQITMVVPTLVFMVPVTILFLLAPVPKLVFGS